MTSLTSRVPGRVFVAVGVVVLLGLAWTGLIGGLQLLTPSQSQGQKLQAAAQIAFGVFALLSVVTTFWGRCWWAFAVTGFAVALSLAAGLFVVVWNRATAGAGIVAGLVASLCAWALIRLLRLGTRGLTRA